MKSPIIVKIDSNTIFRVLLIVLLVLFLYYIRDVILIIFIAFIIVSAIAPVVDWLEKSRLPRAVIVFIIYAVTIGGVSYLLSLLLPAIGEQIKQLGSNIPQYVQSAGEWRERHQYLLGNQMLEKDNVLLNIGNRLSDSEKGIFSQAGSLVKAIFGFVMVISLSFYWNVQRKKVSAFFRALIPDRHQKYTVMLMDRIQQKIGQWLLGQMTLNIIIGLMVYLGLTLLGVPYALLLALVAATFEVVPYIGPLSAAVPAVFIATMQNPLLGLAVAAMYIVIQQLENHLLVPVVMRKAVGLNPVVVIISILVGLKMAGALGAVMAIPLAAAISVFISDFIYPEELKKEGKK